MKLAELRKARKQQLFTLLVKALRQNRRLRDTVGRQLKLSILPPILRHAGHRDDSVPLGWAEQHGIGIPRADGVFESPTAWVRVTHGVIVGAGLKNQSILSLAISFDLLDQGAEHYANLYMDWRAAYHSRLDPTRSGGEGSDSVEAWSKEDRYSKLLIGLDRDYLQVMDCIVAMRPKAKHLAAFHNNQERFVEAFRTVAEAMRQINHNAEQEREKVNSQQFSVARIIKGA